MTLSRRARTILFISLLCYCAFFAYIFILRNYSFGILGNVSATSDTKDVGALGTENNSEEVNSLEALPENVVNSVGTYATSDTEVVGALGTENVSEGTNSLGFLPESVVNSVRKFVFFVGYGRSGHSIIGSLLDAHPNVIIAHEYSVFEKWIDHHQKHRDRRWLYTTLYNASKNSGERKKSTNYKGYTLHIDSSWQGRYDHTVAVIGDKAGGKTTRAYDQNLKSGRFVKAYKELLTTIKAPVVVIHAVRNPFDNIATTTLYTNDNYSLKSKVSPENPYDNPTLLEETTATYFSQVKTVTKIIKDLDLNVTEIHNEDLVNDARGTISKLCGILEIQCTEDYLELCSKKVFRKQSKTRYLIKWTRALRQHVEKEIQSYEFLHRYNFDD